LPSRRLLNKVLFFGYTTSDYESSHLFSPNLLFLFFLSLFWVIVNYRNPRHVSTWNHLYGIWDSLNPYGISRMFMENWFLVTSFLKSCFSVSTLLYNISIENQR
jgi:hypothetical protein